MKFFSLAFIYGQTTAVTFGLADILEVFSKIINTLAKNRVRIWPHIAKAVTTNATLYLPS